MAFSVGQKVIYTSLTGKQEEVTILKRAIDYKEGYINDPNVKGNFDYFVSVVRNGKMKHFFCSEKELK